MDLNDVGARKAKVIHNECRLHGAAAVSHLGAAGRKSTVRSDVR
jgi:hypothetical protein